MLIIYNEATGFVENTIIVGDFERLAEVYQAHGHKVAYATGIPMDRVHQIWVNDGIVELRPKVVVTGEVRSIQADGVDALHLGVAPSAYKLMVKLGDVVVHQEDSTDGTLEFSVDQPGVYLLTFEAEFPFYPFELTVEAT